MWTHDSTCTASSGARATPRGLGGSETGIRIQPLPIWEEEWAHPEAYSNPRLLQNIEREGVRLQ
jgi:hypothetical protein